MPFGAFIRKQREEKNIQMNEFARQLEISPAYWSRIERDMEKPAVVKVVVAFLLVIQAAFSVVVASFLGAVVGLRCTSSIGFQLRVEPDQRFGLALRAAA